MTTPTEARLIPGFTGYAITSDGDVLTSIAKRAKKNGIWLKRKLTRGTNDYLYIAFRLGGRGSRLITRSAHRLVLEAFVGPCPAGKESCHANGVRSDNRVENLRYDTRSANHADKHLHGTSNIGERNGLARFTDAQVGEIKSLLGTISQAKIAAMFGVGQTTISHIARGDTWKHVNCTVSHPNGFKSK